MLKASSQERRRQRMISSHRSRQVGFIEQIKSIFHRLDRCLMFFSRWIAAMAAVCSS
jgi:hypothetical protein